MDVPPVTKMFGMFPLNYATFLIGLFCLGVGGAGLAGIILYGLIQNSIVASSVAGEYGTMKANTPLEKTSIMLIGLGSLMTFFSGLLFLTGVTFKQNACVEIGSWLMFVLCVFTLAMALGGPLACFFEPQTCLIKQISGATMVMGYLAVSLFLNSWLYIMVITFNYLQQMT